MIERIDVDRIFRTAKLKGYLRSEIYCEASDFSFVRLRGQDVTASLRTVEGISLRFFDGQRHLHLTTHDISTGALLELLGSSDPIELPGGSDPNSATGIGCPVPASGMSEKKVKHLLSFSKNLRKDPPIHNLTIEYQDQVKWFEVVHPSGSFGSGREDAATLKAQWQIESAAGILRCEKQCSSASIAYFLETIEKTMRLGTCISKSLERQNPWPAPSGEIPVLWSCDAVSKLMLPLLRAFEGDLVVANLSFLSHQDLDLGLCFSLDDVADTESLPYDHEGTKRKCLSLLHRGRANAILCDNWIAEQLGGVSTGHCRRESFRALPTLGAWRAEIEGNHTSDSILQKMDWGISVGDVEIQQFNPVNTEMIVQLREISLIHHGEEGEAVEPVTLEINLLKLLRSLTLFSSGRTNLGLNVSKHHQQFVVEIMAPEALSEGLAIAGKVPLQHYW